MSESFLHNDEIVKLKLLALVPAGVLACISCFTIPVVAKTKSSVPPRLDRDYISALGAADQFLHAWQTGDHETGVLMLTDAAKAHISEAYLDELFASGGAQSRAYELVRGRKLEEGRYLFPVALFDTGATSAHKSGLPRYSEIVVVKAGRDDWAVDRLP